MKTNSIFLLMSLLLVTLSAEAQQASTPNSTSVQSRSAFNLMRDIRLTNDSKAEEITLEINPETTRLTLVVASIIEKGKITIEVYDPSNTRQGHFTVETQLNSDKDEEAKGNISKFWVEPTPGTWRLKIIPVEATGRIGIRSTTSE